MTFRIVLENRANKVYQKLDRSTHDRIYKFFKKLENIDNPRSIGKALINPIHPLWRYRVGDYKIICDIQDKKVIILILVIGHRSKIYNKL